MANWWNECALNANADRQLVTASGIQFTYNYVHPNKWKFNNGVCGGDTLNTEDAIDELNMLRALRAPGSR